jgi:hypothetical protein
MSWAAAAAPWWLLSLGMLVDELRYHRARGLPVWERVGHPVDTAVMLSCLALTFVSAPTRRALLAFAALSFLSMALITKDEGVHLRACTPGEARLHAALFMLHPLALLSTLAAWAAPEALAAAGADAARLRLALAAQLGVGAAFWLYQVLYWNFLCEAAPASTTTSTTS